MKLPLFRVLVLLLATGMMGAGLTAAESIAAPTPGVVSYTYREEFKRDVPGTLDLIKQVGFRDIEFSNLFGQTATALRALLDARGLTCSSFGVSYDELTQQTDTVAANAAALGAKFVRVAWIPHDGPFTPALARKTAADFNRAGQLLREKYGLTFCYHNHGYEFAPHEGGTLLDVLVNETNPANVSFELDILWAQFPGVPPASLLEKYGSRIKLMHLKNLRKGIVGDLSGKTPVENDVALGTGQIDLPAVLRAARKAGVQHYYIEDESQHTATQVPQSLGYLKGLTL